MYYRANTDKELSISSSILSWPQGVKITAGRRWNYTNTIKTDMSAQCMLSTTETRSIFNRKHLIKFNRKLKTKNKKKKSTDPLRRDQTSLHANLSEVSYPLHCPQVIPFVKGGSKMYTNILLPLI